MTFSPLTSRTIPHNGKYSSRHGRPIIRVIQHHWAGTNGGEQTLANPKLKKSTNYLVLSNGDIVGQVPEEYRAWTSGSFDVDSYSLTIEAQNSEVGGDWPVTDECLRSIVRLLADIATRHGWGGVAASNYRGHREFAQTACPGPFLWSRMASTRNEAHAIVTGKKDVEAPPAPPTSNKSVWQLADEVLAGVHGSGDARRRSLGDRYSAVQAEVNRRLGVSKPGARPIVKSVKQLADEVMAGAHGTGDARKRSLGSAYSAVQAEVNRRLGAGRSSRGPNISELANAVMRGEYGNGPERKRRLGANYKAVQAEVNRRLRR